MFKHTDKEVYLGADIGGSHITVALLNAELEVLPQTLQRYRVNAQAHYETVTSQWLQALGTAIQLAGGTPLKGVGIAMPGPFDYARGISQIQGVDKYGQLYGLNIRQLMVNRLRLPAGVPVVFENDAACFALGETLHGKNGHARSIAITLGTGFGAAFVAHNQVQVNGEGVPPGGVLFNTPYEEGIAEDYISTRGLLAAYRQVSGRSLQHAGELAARALEQEAEALLVFDRFGRHITRCLQPWIQQFKADSLVIGGSISRSAHLFVPVIQQQLQQNGIELAIQVAAETETAAIKGAVYLAQQAGDKPTGTQETVWRKTSQPLMPLEAPANVPDAYSMYPFHHIGPGNIFRGYHSLAQWMLQYPVVLVDGYAGNDWAAIREQLCACFSELEVPVYWFEAAAFLKPVKEIDQLIAPWMGDEQAVWGKKTTLGLQDFFCTDQLEQWQPQSFKGITILAGTGAALSNREAPVVYIDLPKNELQYRMRAGSITNLGAAAAEEPVKMYKRFYFIDWVVLNAYRNTIKNRIAVVADGQWKTDISWALHTSVNKGLQQMVHHCIRVRPWFEAGAWGGQWLKQHIPGLNKAEINYAWSFELIVPENGIVLESEGLLLELSFDWLMEYNAAAVLGAAAERFGTEFPIRFDFLDTFDGGNLSIQCHPSLPYIQEHFGENITQDETYYILDCKANAGVYLGFQENINPAAFRQALEQSATAGIETPVEQYVQFHPAQKHDLFLIPNGTVHSAGANNLVLEISATPYIFTFKMYDWLRLDLNGQPRPINIEHAFNNLRFDRKGTRVKKELLSQPRVLWQQGDDRLVHLPTHADHFYDVHRLEFSRRMTVATEGQCHVLMLVEGQFITVRTQNGREQRFAYAETFILPAAAGQYELVNEGTHPVKVIKAFLK
jgi:predicted NBD/HSP70 family sugar kinase/mannose-6-phosphate isomerase class I